MTARRTILSGSTFEEEIGYARAVVYGDHVETGLADPRMRIEIEVDARRRSPAE